MQQPGARLVCVNGAFERLTGYGRDFAVGRNCRFLQGADTEPAAVQQLVEALRDARPTAVELTNYRRDGSAFRNALVVSPVHDSSGAYRYSLALLADAASLTREEAEQRDRVGRLLPRRFDRLSSSVPSTPRFALAAPRRGGAARRRMSPRRSFACCTTARRRSKGP